MFSIKAHCVNVIQEIVLENTAFLLHASEVLYSEDSYVNKATIHKKLLLSSNTFLYIEVC
jgi:hypothetical protein